jgi:hypothetical protein
MKKLLRGGMVGSLMLGLLACVAGGGGADSEAIGEVGQRVAAGPQVCDGARPTMGTPDCATFCAAFASPVEACLSPILPQAIDCCAEASSWPGVGGGPGAADAMLDAGACAPGQTWCEGRQACVDVMTDPQNCGFCQNTCPSGVCSAGACQSGPTPGGGYWCAGGQTWCEGRQACVDVMTDAQNCGFCQNTCPSGVCSAGACRPPAVPTPMPMPSAGSR